MSSVDESVFIHPMAIVEEGAVIGKDSIIGPFCKVGSEVKLGVGVRLMSHSVVTGRTTVGDFTSVFPMAVIGGDTQSVHHSSVGTELLIGQRCVIREAVTMNRGTVEYGGKTVIGDRNVFLANSHVAHDCKLGNDIILSNNVMLAGHVNIENRVILGGGAAVHQFTRIGRQAFIGGLSAVHYDVIPYGMLNGNPGILPGINVVGMTRAGTDRSKIHRVRCAYNSIFKGKNSIHENAEAIRGEYLDCPEVLNILEFIFADRERPLSSLRHFKEME